ADVSIWSIARTPDEIRQDMTDAPSGSEPDLEAYYPLDEGQGSIVHDASSHHRDATLTPSPFWPHSSVPAPALDLDGDGPTANAPGPQQGPNNLQNTPVTVTSALGQLRGWLGGSLPDTAYRIEFFASAGFGPGGSGEAEDYLGSLDVTTDGSGQAFFDVPYTPPSDRSIVTATATDPGGDTSELSAVRQTAIQVPAAYFRPAPGAPVIFSAAA